MTTSWSCWTLASTAWQVSTSLSWGAGLGPISHGWTYLWGLALACESVDFACLPEVAQAVGGAADQQEQVEDVPQSGAQGGGLHNLQKFLLLGWL